MPMLETVELPDNLNGVDRSALLALVGTVVWHLYGLTKDRELVTFNKWFIHKTFYVRDIHWLLVDWLGAEPAP